MAVVGADHGGEELLGEVIVGSGIDGKCELDILASGVEDVLAAADARIVDEYGRVADFGLDALADGGNIVGVREVDLVGCDVGGCAAGCVSLPYPSSSQGDE